MFVTVSEKAEYLTRDRIPVNLQWLGVMQDEVIFSAGNKKQLIWHVIRHLLRGFMPSISARQKEVVNCSFNFKGLLVQFISFNILHKPRLLHDVAFPFLSKTSFPMKGVGSH